MYWKKQKIRGEEMTKKVFNRFDPFMPIKIDEGSKTSSTFVENNTDEFFDDFNKSTLNESLKFRTPHIKNGFLVVLTKESIGAKNGLGEKLLEDFIYSLSNSFELPQYLIFMNEAVKLLDNEKIEIYISQLKRHGVKSLVSVESLNYFNFSLNNKSVIQATSGDITEKILFSKNLINI